MTTQEASNILANRDNRGIPVVWVDGFTEAIAMAIEALEKQTPKRPYAHIFAPYEPHMLYAQCSCCKRRIRTKRTTKDKYCPKCGQAIDWSEVE